MTRALYLTVTDGDISVSWSEETEGYGLFRVGWDMPSAQFKDGGVYGNSSLSHGQILKHGVFDNVIDVYRHALHFSSINGMIGDIDELEELLMVRAPGYWFGKRAGPTWIERRLDGETNTAYALINQGRIAKPIDIVHPQTPEKQYIEPVVVTINRQPFIYGAAPGTAQKRPEIYAIQDWNFDRVWAEETTLPSGSIFCFAEDDNGDIYAADDMCTHEDASLCTGSLKGHLVKCPLHGSRFDLKSGNPLEDPADEPLRVYPVKIVGNEIFVKLP